MARAFSQSQLAQDDRDPDQWQSLRHELVALLDQVDTQVSRSRDAGLTDRVRDLRRQVADGVPEARHRDALRSVQRQISRFEEPGSELPPNPRESLEAAIQQIRSRQAETRSRAMTPPPAAAPAPAPVPRFDTAMLDKLAGSVNGLASRLERLEGEIHAQVRNGGDIKDVAGQVSQLAHVVELLAGAVGETGQVKRLEGQIASLARVIAQGREMDSGTLNRRLDDVAATVGKLAELQVHYVDKVESPVAAQALKDGLRSIEDSVRAVYDRIDSLEHQASLSPQALEEVTVAMAHFTDAMRDQNVAPQGLVELIDALNGRIAELENGDRLVQSLRKDLNTLRDAVLVSLAPRFEAIERRMDGLSTRDDMAEIGRQIGQLSERLGDGSAVDAPGIGALEAQVRQLVARMDQTGEQLSGLARLYSEPAPVPMPDLHELADMVAERAAAAMPKPVDAGVSDSLSALEVRIAEMLGSMQRDPEVSDFGDVRAGIDEVNERLKRLEASLLDRQSAVPPSRGHDDIASIITASATGRSGISDTMPRDPDADAPLIDPPFPEPAGPVQEALGMQARWQHPGLDTDSLAARHDEPIAPVPAPAARTPMPAAPLPSAGFESSADEPVPPSSRSTFIAAHRRAAARPAKPQPSPDSLIGRALSRFHLAGSEIDAAPLPVPPAAAKAATSRPARIEPVAVEPSPAVPDVTVDAASAESDASENFLLRHRKAILLGAAVVAIAFLAVNLIAQRLAAPSDTPSAEQPALAAPATTGDIAAPASDADAAMDALTASMPPRVIPLTQATQDGTVDSSTSPAFVATPIPTAPSSVATGDATSSVPAQDGGASNLQTATLDTEAPSALAPAPLTTPTDASAAPATASTPLPPDALGPIDLRQAAASGDAHAEFEIAAIYTEGRVVPQDFAQAATWYQRSADQGFAPAEYRLGSLYESGKGVSKDVNIALQWYEKAALAGNRMSMHNLASLYAGGALGKQQFDKAAQWFEQAANLGLTDSQFNLGMLYARGLGVAQSLKDSYKWFAIAALTGDKDAAKARDDIARSLDADTVKSLGDEVAAFKPQQINLAANFAPIGTWSKSFNPGETITSKDIVLSVQNALTRLGYDVGTPDGVAGKKTADAIKSFESGTGMNQVGLVNPRLLAVLGSQPV